MSASLARRRMSNFGAIVFVQTDCNRSRPVIAAFDAAPSPDGLAKD